MRIILTSDPELPVPPKPYGGIERIGDLLITGLQNFGHEVHPLTALLRSLAAYGWLGVHIFL